MKAKFQSIPLVKNGEKQRFEVEIEGYTAFIDYKDEGGVVRLIHTESPEALAGRGVATALVEKTPAYLDENGYRLVPVCPLVSAYVKRHPEWKRIVDESALPRAAEFS